MNKQKLSWYLAITVLITSSVTLVGCSSQFAESVRKVTYPPNFKYTKPDELRSDMGKLAQQMLLLDEALVNTYASDENGIQTQRQLVLKALQNMGKTAAKLSEGDSGGNHPYIQAHLKGFVAKIDQAKTAASLQAPNYYYAGKVSGGCTNCHKVNR
jgi:hypothetical protein